MMKAVKKEEKKIVSTGKEIRKRNGTLVPFEIERIESAVWKAMRASEEVSEADAGTASKKVAKHVLTHVSEKRKADKGYIPSVEEVQDMVEQALITENYGITAKAYILYREKRSELRLEQGSVPEHIKKLVHESKQYFKNPLGEFLFYRTYARWIEDEGRRETWIETIDRYMNFMRENLGSKLKDAEYKELREAILKQEVMPSMRLLQFAGKAARSTNVCAYNCSFIAPSKFRDFAEIMYISMCGTGVGWSVESRNIQSLPQIKRQTGKMLPVNVIHDSKEGWCDSLILGMNTWAQGNDIKFDFSKLRPAGARLATMGGKSSGPEPLRQLLDFTRERMIRRQGRRLSNLDAHDIICKIGEIVVSGGVRRSAMISLSDLDDDTIRDSKKGQFYLNEPQRSLANNSAVYEEKPTASDFLEEWIALVKSGSGERGIFNRGSLSKTLPARRLEQFEGEDFPQFGTNPCGEIILQSKQFCNLSEVVARAEDKPEDLFRKVRLATLIGTYQATLTDFPYLSSEWQENCEAERLLGVSITGQWDCPAVRKAETLNKMKLESIKANKIYAKRFGINQSTCITCVKPSGNVSQTVDCSSGMHPRHSQYYIRRVRIAGTDSLFKMLRDQGVPYHPEVGQSAENATTYVIDFPVKAPSGSIFRNDQTALEQLEYWKLVKEHYTEHNPSVTISVGDSEWIETAHWLYKNWDMIGGLSFLPRSEHVYQLAPYEETDEKNYKEMLKHFDKVDFSKIMTYEKFDETEVKKELACVAGVCEIEMPVQASAQK